MAAVAVAAAAVAVAAAAAAVGASLPGAPAGAPPEAPAGPAPGEPGRDAGGASHGARANGTLAQGPPPAVPAPHAAGPPASAVDASNGFAIAFYRQAAAGGGNVVFSPPAIYMQFAALHEGAGGETAGQMRRVFGLWPDAERRLGAAAHVAESFGLYGRPGLLGAAGAVWVGGGAGPGEEYRRLAGDAYLVEARAAGPDSGATAAMMEEWAAGAAGGRIGRVGADGSGPVSTASAASLYGTLALHPDVRSMYRGPDTFRSGDGRDVPATYMSAHFGPMFEYGEAGGARVVAIPYLDGRLQMLLALPAGNGGLGAVEESLSLERLDAWDEALAWREMSAISVPKFEVRQSHDLGAGLAALGMPAAFAPGADLGGVGPGALHVGSAAHHAHMRVDDVDAWRAEPHMRRSAIPESTGDVAAVADSPFIFMVRDAETGLILIMGRVWEPAEPGLPPAGPAAPPPAPGAAVPAGVAEAVNEMAVEVYRGLAAGRGDVLFSPQGLHAALAVLSEGARGETAEILRGGLGLGPGGAAGRGAAAGALAAMNRGGGGAELAAGTAAWFADWLEPRPSYVEAARREHRADAEVVGFGHEYGSEKVRHWPLRGVDGSNYWTPDRARIGAGAAAVAGSSTYAGGRLAAPPEGGGAPAWPGHPDSGGPLALVLPYEGGRLSLLAVLPDREGGIRGLEGAISPGQIREWREGALHAGTESLPPRLPWGAGREVGGALGGIGTGGALGAGAADLSGLAPAAGPGGGLHVAGIRHDAFLSAHGGMAEHGSATAITVSPGPGEAPAAGGGPGGELPPRTAEERSALLAVLDEESGMVLLMGRVWEPATHEAAYLERFDGLGAWDAEGGWAAADPGWPHGTLGSGAPAAAAVGCPAACAMTLAEDLDLSGLDGAELSLWSMVNGSLGEGEGLTVEVTGDGGRTWDPALERTGEGGADGTWRLSVIGLDGYLGPGFNVRVTAAVPRHGGAFVDDLMVARPTADTLGLLGSLAGAGGPSAEVGLCDWGVDRGLIWASLCVRNPNGAEIVLEGIGASIHAGRREVASADAPAYERLGPGSARRAAVTVEAPPVVPGSAWTPEGGWADATLSVTARFGGPLGQFEESLEEEIRVPVDPAASLGAGDALKGCIAEADRLLILLEDAAHRARGALAGGYGGAEVAAMIDSEPRYEGGPRRLASAIEELGCGGPGGEYAAIRDAARTLAAHVDSILGL